MKKILFIDNIQNIRIDYFRYSTGLLTLATILGEKGYDVEILNFDYLFIKGILPYGADPIINFEYLIQYIMDKTYSFSRCTRLFYTETDPTFASV